MPPAETNVCPFPRPRRLRVKQTPTAVAQLHGIATDLRVMARDRTISRADLEAIAHRIEALTERIGGGPSDGPRD